MGMLASVENLYSNQCKAVPLSRNDESTQEDFVSTVSKDADSSSGTHGRTDHQVSLLSKMSDKSIFITAVG